MANPGPVAARFDVRAAMSALELPFVTQKLLVINPNTNPRVTERIRTVAAQLACRDSIIDVRNPHEGPISIETSMDRAAAEPRVIEMIRQSSLEGTHGFVLACFDDIGVAEARRLAPGPVIDACEAGIIAARCLTDQFAIVTTVESAVARIKTLVSHYSSGSCCTIRAAGIGVADAASGEGAERLHAVIAKSLECDRAKAIILGSGGLTGQADDLSRHFGIPVIDGVGAAISICLSILRLKLSYAF